MTDNYRPLWKRIDRTEANKAWDAHETLRRNLLRSVYGPLYGDIEYLRR